MWAAASSFFALYCQSSWRESVWNEETFVHISTWKTPFIDLPITSETRAEIVAAPGADNSMLYIPASSAVAESIWRRSEIKDQRSGKTYRDGVCSAVGRGGYSRWVDLRKIKDQEWAAVFKCLTALPFLVQDASTDEPEASSHSRVAEDPAKINSSEIKDQKRSEIKDRRSNEFRDQR